MVGELDWYMKRIRKYPVLTNEQEAACVARYRATGDRRYLEPLINSVLPFVVRAAHGFKGFKCASLPDLVQSANLAVCQGAVRFDPARGYRFISYAAHWVRAGLYRAVYANLSLVKYGTNNAQRTLLTALNKRRLDEPVEVFAARMGVTSEQVTEAEIRLAGRDASLDVRQGLGDDVGISHTTWLDTFASNDESAEVQLSRFQDRVTINEALCELTPRERYIVEQRSYSTEPKSLAALGRGFGFSRERARQIEASAFAKLREKLA